jgi:DNA-directed RNA polymerase subunit M/transcription elongation factor TFIIS
MNQTDVEQQRNQVRNQNVMNVMQNLYPKYNIIDERLTGNIIEYIHLFISNDINSFNFDLIKEIVHAIGIFQVRNRLQSLDVDASIRTRIVNAVYDIASMSEVIPTIKSQLGDNVVTDDMINHFQPLQDITPVYNMIYNLMSISSNESTLEKRASSLYWSLPQMLYEVRSKYFELYQQRIVSDAKEGFFKCGKCKSKLTDVTPMQTRSADEPMTLIINCMNCGNHWRTS